MMLATIEPGPSAGLRTMPQVRTFDRYAEALTLLFAARMVDLRFGILVHIRELVHRNDRARLV
jgi:hypothetical protein